VRQIRTLYCFNFMTNTNYALPSRVISDLIFAISCGRINNQQLMSLLAAARNAVPSVDEDFEMSAIQTWTEVSFLAILQAVVFSRLNYSLPQHFSL
jgi:hypothetical protein